MSRTQFFNISLVLLNVFGRDGKKLLVATELILAQYKFDQGVFENQKYEYSIRAWFSMAMLYN